MRAKSSLFITAFSRLPSSSLRKTKWNFRGDVFTRLRYPGDWTQPRYRHDGITPLIAIQARNLDRARKRRSGNYVPPTKRERSSLQFVIDRYGRDDFFSWQFPSPPLLLPPSPTHSCLGWPLLVLPRLRFPFASLFWRYGDFDFAEHKE